MVVIHQSTVGADLGTVGAGLGTIVGAGLGTIVGAGLGTKDSYPPITEQQNPPSPPITEQLIAQLFKAILAQNSNTADRTLTFLRNRGLNRVAFV
ncbi:hypothetical protein [Coleofasciculus sp. E1-EBD-02]|uniref:hypothetical protein n=1 Tax=Coleofasciculus sp. E1-EBD-02 TaxID=3068481 RepID=UPI0032F73BB4